MNKRIFWPIVFMGIFLVFWSSNPCAAQDSGKLYVLGMGPNGPDLTAPRAMKILKNADVVLCHPQTRKEFQEYISEEKYAFNPWEGIHGGQASQLRKKHYQKWLQRVEKKQKEVQDYVMKQIEKGKTVVMLDSGDPCVYGPALYWILEDFPRQHLEVIPGMSAFNAASAALKQPMIGENGFVVLTSPHTLLKENNKQGPDLLKDMAKYNPTLVLYMALKSMDELVKVMKKHYPHDLPAAVVYFAGHPDKEKVVRGNLNTIVEKIKNHSEDWLGMVIIGQALS